MKPLIEHFDDHLENVEFFNADLSDPNSIDMAV
jgi:hypothetical protein